MRVVEVTYKGVIHFVPHSIRIFHETIIVAHPHVTSLMHKYSTQIILCTSVKLSKKKGDFRAVKQKKRGERLLTF